MLMDGLTAALGDEGSSSAADFSCKYWGIIRGSDTTVCDNGNGPGCHVARLESSVLQHCG